MKIISKFKDYYDWVGKKYGAEPGIVYNRGEQNVVNTGYSIYNFVPRLKEPEDGNHYKVKLLIVGLSSFVVIEITGRADDEFTKPEAVKELFGEKHEFLRPTHKHYRSFVSPTREELIRLIKVVGHPVFLLEEIHHYKAHNEKRTPILQEYGIPTVLSAEQAWQNISEAITTVLRKNPDKDPPVRISNDNKIIAAGFDLKTSFRNPIK